MLIARFESDTIPHLPAPPDELRTLAPTVVKALCGQLGIGKILDRGGFHCPACRALSEGRPMRKREQRAYAIQRARRGALS
jgi:hypothetical protein